MRVVHPCRAEKRTCYQPLAYRDDGRIILKQADLKFGHLRAFQWSRSYPDDYATCGADCLTPSST